MLKHSVSRPLLKTNRAGMRWTHTIHPFVFIKARLCPFAWEIRRNRPCPFGTRFYEILRSAIGLQFPIFRPPERFTPSVWLAPIFCNRLMAFAILIGYMIAHIQSIVNDFTRFRQNILKIFSSFSFFYKNFTWKRWIFSSAHAIIYRVSTEIYIVKGKFYD